MNLISRLKLNWYDDRDTRSLVYGGEYTFRVVPDKILDLGAHKGIVSEYFAKKYPGAEIHAYEPNPKMYRKLLARIRNYKNVKAFNEAIAHDGTVEFSISERDVSSSIFGNGERIHVPSVSLQTALARLGPSAAVKMDIEGAEFEALRAIPAGVIEIVGELHPQKAGRSNYEIRNLLTAQGFSVVEIGSVAKCPFRASRFVGEKSE